MLNKFRKGADNIFVRILLGFIALSFIGFGASSFLGGNTGGDVITFSKAKPISKETFLAMKAKEIDYIQRENNINFTEEQIKDLNIDHQILQKLVNEEMISYLASIYDFDLSESAVINFVKRMPYFQGEDGKFDLVAFKAAFRNSQRQEDEYLSNLKISLIKTTLLNVFMESFQPSKNMSDNVVNYMAETKYFDLASVDLTDKAIDLSNQQIQDKELEEFYRKNENDFVVPELRSFDYILIDKDFFAKKIKIDSSEAKIYYEENKNDFDNKPYSSVHKEVNELLFTNKLEEMMSVLSKTMEEEIAGGSGLKDIAQKYNLKIESVPSTSQAMLNADEGLKLGDFADSVFDMIEKEVSYPMELQDQHKIILIELKNIIPSRKQEFAEVKERIFSILKERATMMANARILEEFRNNYKAGGKMTHKKILIEHGKSITRADMQVEEKINPELANLIFKTSNNQATDIVRVGKRAYFAFVKNSAINKEKAKRIWDSSAEQIVGTIKEGVMQDLVSYLIEQNEMKIKQL